MSLQKISSELLKIIKAKKLTPNQIEKAKIKLAEKYGLRKIPLNVEILNAAPQSIRLELSKFIKTKPTRTVSGVSIVAVAAKPAPCPGQCIYCPKGEEAPQSYTGYEPAMLRARSNKYDPFKQVENRLWQLDLEGHDLSKNELIVLGGNFPSQDWKYQKWFIKRCFDAFNEKTSRTLKQAQKLNETAKHRVVGLTLECRPDTINTKKFLELGCTRIELGLQSVYDSVLKKVCRGHTVQEAANTIKKLKDNCFKVLLHIMLGLPGSSLKKDIEMFKILFKDERFKPDAVKIYPTLVVKGTELYNIWMKGEYTPVNADYVHKVLKEFYKVCPPYCRLHRAQRDIPREHFEAGPIRSSIRQDVLEEIHKSKEIRFREAGHVFNRSGCAPKHIEITVKKYKASGGEEYFIAAEDVGKNILVGFCRLRLVRDKPAMVRELHVYSEVAPIGAEGVLQHKGWGARLLKKAEEIAKKDGKKNIIIISGCGVKLYYKNRGYNYAGAYMSKVL